MNKLSELYQKDPISFYYVDSNTSSDFEKNFDGANVVLYRYQKLRYANYTKEEISYDSIRAFIDDILSGNSKHLKFIPFYIKWNFFNSFISKNFNLICERFI